MRKLPSFSWPSMRVRFWRQGVPLPEDSDSSVTVTAVPPPQPQKGGGFYRDRRAAWPPVGYEKVEGEYVPTKIKTLGEAVTRAGQRPDPRRRRRKFRMWMRFQHELKFATDRGIFMPRLMILGYVVWLPMVAMFAGLLWVLGIEWNKAVAFFIGFGGFPMFLVAFVIWRQLSVKVIALHEWGESVFRRPLSQWYNRGDAQATVDGKQAYIVLSGDDPDPYRLENCPPADAEILEGRGNDSGEMYNNSRPWEMQYLASRSYKDRGGAMAIVVEHGPLILINIIIWILVFFMLAEIQKPT